MRTVMDHSLPEAERARTRRMIDRIYANSGIERRHSVIPDYCAGDPSEFELFPPNWALEPFPSTGTRMEIYERECVALAEPAVRAALEQSGCSPRDVTHLLLCSSTGFFSPGPDVLLMQRLGMRRDVKRTVIGFMGCFLAFQGLAAADQIVRADPDAIVVQVCVDLCTLHFQKSRDVGDLVVNALFADGCAVAVFGAARPDALVEVVTTASLADADNLGKMTWKIGDTGFEMFLSGEIPALLGESVAPFTRELLASAGLDRADVDGWVVHPGGRKIIEAVRDGLGLQDEDVATAFRVLRDYGNMSCPTMMFVLDEHRREAPEAGYSVALGFGPGLGIEGAVLRRCS